MVVGYVGRLAAEKSVRRLVEVSRVPGVELVVVGDGPERDWLERRLPRATFTGMLGGTDLARAFATLDVFVHPGENETFCQTVQEAQASGVAVVAAGRGGPLDLVEDGRTGLLYDAEDPRSLRRAVATVVGDPLLRRTLARAGARPGRRADLGALVDRLVSAALRRRRLAGRRGARGRHDTRRRAPPARRPGDRAGLLTAPGPATSQASVARAPSGSRSARTRTGRPGLPEEVRRPARPAAARRLDRRRTRSRPPRRTLGCSWPSASPTGPTARCGCTRPRPSAPRRRCSPPAGGLPADYVPDVTVSSSVATTSPTASGCRSRRPPGDPPSGAAGGGREVVVGTCPDLGALQPVPQPLRELGRQASRRLAFAQREVVVRNGGYAVSLAAVVGPVLRGPPRRDVRGRPVPSVRRRLPAYGARDAAERAGGHRAAGGRASRAPSPVAAP